MMTLYEKLSLPILLLYLLPAGIRDLRSLCVPLWYLLGGCAAALVAAAIQIMQGSLTWHAAILSVMPGLMLLMLSRVSEKKIGEADGILFLTAGLVLGSRNTCILLTISLVLSSLCAIVLLLLRKVTLRTRIPFVPFAAAGSALLLLAQMQEVL
ncbi:MAG: prepilin peptidase [Lachnospiraceae bacterium]|nr:prepilin peptidase [Lachnospiraceae bacterium]